MPFSPHKKRRYTQSSSFKMAALFLCALGISASLLAYMLYHFSEDNLVRETEVVIDREIEKITLVTSGKNTDNIAKIIDYESKSSSDQLYFYYSANEKKLAGNLDILPNNVILMREGLLRFTLNWNGRKRPFATKVHTFPDSTRLLIARDISDIVVIYDKLKTVSILIMALMAFVVLVSFLISVFVVSRTNNIAETARHIMHTGDFSQRITIDSDWDDLSNLSHVLNTMFAQTETLMQNLRHVGDNIAHDLRTPLTRLRNQLEQASTNSISTADAKQLLAEADRLLATFNALLRISRVERSASKDAFIAINATALLDDVIQLYEPLAEESGIALKQSIISNASIYGDRDLLFQAVANVLDNAIKFSPPNKNSQICISLAYANNHTTITISDEGLGVDASQHDKLFDRFYRTEQSRNTPGNGLGLSLTKAIIEAHGGTIVLESNTPGLIVKMTI